MSDETKALMFASAVITILIVLIFSAHA